ncbi:MAG: tetratricopeptide repeat protein [Bacteriovoracaceae bacterium]
MKEQFKELSFSNNETDRKKCITLLEKYLLTKPNDIEAWYDKAGCHDFIGEEKTAELCYQKCYELGWIQLSTLEQKSFFVGYGSTLRNNSKYDESIRILDEGIKNFPDYPALQVFLSLAYYSKKMEHKAAQTLLQATSLIAKFGLDGYEKAIQSYSDNLLNQSSNKIRTIALAILKNDKNQFLFYKSYDKVTNEFFYRALGGGVEFFETGELAVVREIEEEIGKKIIVESLAATLENIFTHDGKKGHEIVLLYKTKFNDLENYNKSEFVINENGKINKAIWKSLDEIRSERAKLYPVGVEKVLLAN